MAIREILTFPHPVLRKQAKSVSAVTDEHRKLAEDMLETMYEAQGIGLAAPQVGESIRFLVIDTRPRENGRYVLDDMTDLEQKAYEDGPLFIFNPVIKVQNGKQTYDEGCLSVPSYYETVERADSIEVEFLNLKGEKKTLKADGLLSVCLQHEMDHLDGKLFIDRIGAIKGQRIKEKILKNGYPKKKKSRADQKSEELEPEKA